MLFGVTPLRASHALKPIAQDDDRLAIGRREASSSSPIFISPTQCSNAYPANLVAPSPRSVRPIAAAISLIFKLVRCLTPFWALL
nr:MULTISPECIES: hypothetical protein [Rhizobium]